MQLVNVSETQQSYWNNVAWQKTFTHPLNTAVLNQYFRKDFSILDYGCGYGRIVAQLNEMGYQKVLGVLDYVSGMTDNYAADLYKKIKGIDIGMTI